MARDDAGAGGPRVVIAGGGTGGHLTPALSLGRELSAAPWGARVLLVGGDRGADRELLPSSGLPYRILPAPPLARGGWWRNVGLPLGLLRAVAAARRALAEFRPHVVVGTGGYVSVPIGIAAGIGRVPLLLVEPNRTPGLATRLLARWARTICLTFPESAAALSSGARIEVTGSPIAPPEPAAGEPGAILDPDRPTLGVFGGSQGARAINDLVLGIYGAAPDDAPNLIWQAGAGDEARVRVAAAWPRRVVVRAFFSPMAAVYPLLDLAVCRAGAMTVAELTAWGLPSILVPYPHATDDHQTANARALEAAGAAEVVVEAGATPAALGARIAALLGDTARRARMSEAARSLGRPDAARRVAAHVVELAARPASARGAR